MVRFQCTDIMPNSSNEHESRFVNILHVLRMDASGISTLSALHGVPHRRRRKVPNRDTKRTLPCVVCGAEANGYNFDVFSCDSCKVFFRRTVKRGNGGVQTLDELSHQCIFGTGQCVINKTTRTRCPPCRMKRCLEMGMKREWITPISRLVLRSNYNSKKKKSFPRHKEHPTSEVDSQRSEIHAVEESDHSKAGASTLLFNNDLATQKFNSTIFQSYQEQVDRAYRILMEPVTEEDVERYNLRLQAPSVEITFNSKECAVRRLIRVFKELPQFALLTKPTQMALMKEAMRGMSGLFFILHFQASSRMTVFEYISRAGEVKYAGFRYKNVVRQIVRPILPWHLAVILSIFKSVESSVPVEPLNILTLQDAIEANSMTSTFILDDLLSESVVATPPKSVTKVAPLTNSSSLCLTSSPRIKLQPSTTDLTEDVQLGLEPSQMVDQIAECMEEVIYQIVQSVDSNGMLLTIVCLLRLYRVDEESPRLPLNKHDRYLVQKTRAELTWFLHQYAKYIWSCSSELLPAEDANDSREFPRLPSSFQYTSMAEPCCDMAHSSSASSMASTISRSPQPSLAERMADLDLIYERLLKTEKFKVHLEYFLNRDHVSPLMREFLPTERKPS